MASLQWPGLRAVAGGLAQLRSTADATCNRPVPANHSLAKGECRRPSQSKFASPDVAGKHVVGGMISSENARGILPRRTAAPISLQRSYLYSSGAPPQTNRQREFRALLDRARVVGEAQVDLNRVRARRNALVSQLLADPEYQPLSAYNTESLKA